MPLSPPAPRTLKHVRRVNYQGFERDDGLWDIEGELHDSKAYDAPSFRDACGTRRAGDPIHHMWLRVTVNRQLVVQAIEVAMDAHPLKGCQGAQPALQRMVGCSMARGWRQAIQKHLGGVELPFGGVKSSGYGREKGFEALYGFTTLKTVAIKYG